MRTSVLLALSAAAALAAGSALAQDAMPNTDTAVNPPAAAATDTAAAPAAGYASSDTLGDSTKMKAGDPNVVSNGPVPDTPQNRAQFGGPRSNAGKHTAPSGD